MKNKESIISFLLKILNILSFDSLNEIYAYINGNTTLIQ